jgi:lysophospholipase L1-like esterase
MTRQGGLGAVRASLLSGLFVLCGTLAACGSSPPTATAGTPLASGSHAPTPERGAAAQLGYAALGASETYGIGANRVTSGYAYRLRDTLRLDPSRFADVGIPGATLANAYQNELSNALAIQPTVCTVFFGVNDIRDQVPVTQFASDLTDLLSTLRRAGCRVLVIGVPQLKNLPALRSFSPTQLAGLTLQWNSAIQGAAASTGAAYLSLEAFSGELLSHPELVASDGLHPSDVGHARLAAIILAALQANRYLTP